MKHFLNASIPFLVHCILVWLYYLEFGFFLLLICLRFLHNEKILEDIEQNRQRGASCHQFDLHCLKR